MINLSKVIKQTCVVNMCCFFLMCKVRGYTMRDITDQFTLNVLSNDEFAYNFIDERFYYCMRLNVNNEQSCTCHDLLM